MAKINKATAGIMLAAVVAGGAIGAATLPAMADAGSSSSSSAAPSTGSGTAGTGTRGPHQANGKTEEILTGDTAAKVEAAVKAAQPDATIERMETDADGATYEAHITKADGTHATVLLDENFTVTSTEEGQGGPGGRGGHGPGGNDGDADDSGSNTTTPSPSSSGAAS
ncbi:hypothetical protein [Paenarthrobacter nitroguajacolicus]|uniref:hypothetical protein n=1 Tax=Paenarthrobacter nitroguajacolicus TaxID=211146 RepID=UPI00248C8DCD|nr:hypothetical protein [Paenarthrobacter nitroguajacolicus]MDI2035119.1 hypothetical protein [Paenarthrobacter nitroguajacolicus]